MRDDLSNKLIHLTKGVGDDMAKHREEALKSLCSILKEKRLRGGDGYIKGGHLCVCFSEAPIGKLAHLLAEKDGAKFKYQPYGIMVDKTWLFQLGGRPVIYGPESDYEKLREEMQYRHVRFWLSREYKIDHTSEREWRHKTSSLTIAPEDVTVVVPDRDAKDVISHHFFEDNWHYIVLSDLGVAVNSL